MCDVVPQHRQTAPRKQRHAGAHFQGCPCGVVDNNLAVIQPGACMQRGGSKLQELVTNKHTPDRISGTISGRIQRNYHLQTIGSKDSRVNGDSYNRRGGWLYSGLSRRLNTRLARRLSGRLAARLTRWLCLRLHCGLAAGGSRWSRTRMCGGT